ncbi:acyltransferase [Mucilaginibacter corticis]|uniref:Acyltransferase n=1 Tax=Mucilaginibacter corticis TaxID=2597670 RepID=A0A556MM13_9SPHI|nr:acyltransferase [Mucilaginibacter corticis]TSJ40888.1 acyltransferase [Mucilaginibacter corticis]
MQNILPWMRRDELENRNFGLDLFRFFAITLVLIDHTMLGLFKYRSLRPFEDYCGLIGVELFFVLSGFLIGTIIIKIHDNTDVTTFKNIKSFWVRRWFRTLPNFLLVFAIYLVVFNLYKLYIPYYKLPLYLVFLQNCFSTEPGFYGVTWSLSIEEWFYLTFPLILLAYQHFVPRSKQKSIFFTIATFIVICLLLRVAWMHFDYRGWDEGFRKQMPLRLDSISIGVLAATIKYYYQKFWFNNKNKMVVLGIIMFCLATSIVYHFFLRGNLMQKNFFMDTFYFTIMSVAIGLLLPFVYSLKAPRLKFIQYAVTYVSIISYSLYLIHPIFSYLVPYYFAGRLNPIVESAIMWVLVIIASHLIYNLFEKKITVLRNKYSDKKEPAAA